MRRIVLLLLHHPFHCWASSPLPCYSLFPCVIPASLLVDSSSPVLFPLHCWASSPAPTRVFFPFHWWARYSCSGLFPVSLLGNTLTTVNTLLVSLILPVPGRLVPPNVLQLVFP